MGSFDGRRGWINHLAVDPDYQGNSIGQKMMSELERRYKKLGCEKINLLIEMDNGKVQEFYKKRISTRGTHILEKWI